MNCKFCNRGFSSHSNTGLCQICEKVNLADLHIVDKCFVITADLLYSKRANNEQLNCLRLAGYDQHFKLFVDKGDPVFSGYIHKSLKDKTIPLAWGIVECECKTITYRNDLTGQYETI